MLFEAIFMSFRRQKAKIFSGTLPPEPPPEPCHGLAWGLTATPRPPVAFWTTYVFHAHIIWTL